MDAGAQALGPSELEVKQLGHELAPSSLVFLQIPYHKELGAETCGALEM